MTSKSYTIIYQAAKLGDVSYLLRDFELARQLDAQGTPIGRIYGNSSGVLVALAHFIEQWTGCKNGAEIAFEDIRLPFYATVTHLVDALQETGQSAILAHHDLPDLKGNWQRAWDATR